VEVSKKDELLRAEVGRTQLAAQQIAELQAELTNNAGGALCLPGKVGILCGVWEY